MEELLDIIFAIIGLVLLAFTFVDALWTTLWLSGSAGPLSARVTTRVWQAARTIGGGRSGVLSLFGPIILLLIIAIWVVLLWAGWVLVFSASGGAIVDSSSGAPAGWEGRIYFVGFTLFTLGMGDLVPQGALWRTLTVLASGSGMLLVTLAVTYVLSVVSAAVNKRSIASQVTGLGDSAEEIVSLGWNGRDLRRFDLPLDTLSSQISTLAEQYRAYPILQYYHERQAASSPPIGIATLDEALTLMRFGVPEDHRPNPVVLRSTRAAVQSLLDTLESAFIRPAEEVPPAPDLASLRERGLPTVSDDEFQQALSGLESRRRKLLGLVKNDGRDWPGTRR